MKLANPHLGGLGTGSTSQVKPPEAIVIEGRSVRLRDNCGSDELLRVYIVKFGDSTRNVNCL